MLPIRFSFVKYKTTYLHLSDVTELNSNISSSQLSPAKTLSHECCIEKQAPQELETLFGLDFCVNMYIFYIKEPK